MDSGPLQMVQLCPVLKTQVEAQGPPDLPGHHGDLLCEQQELSGSAAKPAGAGQRQAIF